MNTEFTRKEINDLKIIFDNDTSIQHLYYIYNIYLTDKDEEELSILLLSNSEIINNNSIDELYTYGTKPFINTELISFFELENIPRDLYNQIMYVFKYGTIRKFFKDNWEKYLPNIDVLNIKDNEKMLLFQEALMQEFDRFSDIIDKVYNILDVDEVPNEYLNYLAQLIGYEREEDVILTDIAFRELLKNIIEVYRIKGTNFSFELFFNFLGFEVELKEYWFDKRFFYGIATNPETSETERDKALFYLSSIKPTDYIPTGMKPPYIIVEDEITETLDLNMFQKYLEVGTYTIRQLLGIDPGYEGVKYEYFKTNVMEYKLTAISSNEESSLTAEQNRVIKSYSNFLTPIFIKNNIIVIIPPFEEDASSLILEDFLKQHSIDYLGNRFDDPSVLDTEEKFFSRDIINKSFYSAVKDFYNLENENKILDKIDELMDGSSEDFWNNIIDTYYDTGTIFEGVAPLRRREIFYPLRDILYKKLHNNNYDKIKMTSITLGADYNYDDRRLDYTKTYEEKGIIKSTNTTLNTITVDDLHNSFYKLKPMSYCKLNAMISRSQNGIYLINNVTKSGTDTIITIDNTTPLQGVSQVSQGGYIIPYYEEWTLGNHEYPFLFNIIDINT